MPSAKSVAGLPAPSSSIQERIFFLREQRRVSALISRKYDHQFKVVFEAFRALMDEPVKPKRPIDFRADAALVEMASAAIK